MRQCYETLATSESEDEGALASVRRWFSGPKRPPQCAHSCSVRYLHEVLVWVLEVCSHCRVLQHVLCCLENSRCGCFAAVNVSSMHPPQCTEDGCVCNLQEV